MSTYGNPLTDYSPQMEYFDNPAAAAMNESTQGVLSEMDEMELTAEFLEISDEAELEQFLDGLFDVIGKIAKSPIGQAVRGLVKKALPIAGKALGATFGGGPLGAIVGGQLGDVAGNVLGLELEGLSAEDREFEASRQFIRFVAQTIANAEQAHPDEDPDVAAHRAAKEAARVHAPGLMNIAETTHHHRRHRSGRWIRHGDRIILLGV